MSDTRKWAYEWADNNRLVRRELSLAEQVECLERDIELILESFRERVAVLEALVAPEELARIARERVASGLASEVLVK